MDGFRLCRVFGIDIRIHWTWAIIIVIFSYFLQARFHYIIVKSYPGVFENITAMSWFLGLASALLLFLCVILHELGHALTAKRYGFDVSSITLFLFGGMAHIEDLEQDASAIKSFWIVIMGPLVSLCIGVLLLGMLYIIPNPGFGQMIIATRLVLIYLGVINIALAVFNMLPLYPMDGGRVFMSVIRFCGVSYQKARTISRIIGVGFAGSLIFLGIVSAITGELLGLVGGAWIAIIMTFMALLNLSELRAKGSEDE